MNINLKQSSTYNLRFPFTVNGESVQNIFDAFLTLYRNGEEVQRYSLGPKLTFSDSSLSVEFLEHELRGSYTYEVWIKDTNNKPVYITGGVITINSTRARFQ